MVRHSSLLGLNLFGNQGFHDKNLLGKTAEFRGIVKDEQESYRDIRSPANLDFFNDPESLLLTIPRQKRWKKQAIRLFSHPSDILPLKKLPWFSLSMPRLFADFSLLFGMSEWKSK
jgi:hypothetical protein